MIHKAPYSLAIFVTVIMLLAQLGVAQHSAVHFTEHSHSIGIQSNHDNHHDHGDHHNDHDNNEEHANLECEICAITQSLSLALINKHSFSTQLVAISYSLPKTDSYIAGIKHEELYSPRAPPLLLI